MISISKRLIQVADMVFEGNRVADIGTDHGYLPIYLIENRISPSVIAMDVNKGPLSRADKNIAEAGYTEYIQTRISNGFEKLKVDEADTVTICGMGGRLMMSIITDGIDLVKQTPQLIFSPQSEIKQFREFLCDTSIVIDYENILCEDGKFYWIMSCHYDENAVSNIETKDAAAHTDTYNRYGRNLLIEQNPVLHEYLLKEKQKYTSIMANVVNCDSQNKESRLLELTYELKCIEEGLKYYEA